MSASGGHSSASGGHVCPREVDIFVREQLTCLSASGGHLSASGGHVRGEHCPPADDCPPSIISMKIFFRKIFADFVRGGQLSAADNCPRRTLADIGQNFFRRTMADFFLADCPPVDGGSDRIRSDPPRTLADFLCPHKVRLSPPESAKKRSSADTGADSGGQWRTQADPIGSAADSGGQLSASIKPAN